MSPARTTATGYVGHVWAGVPALPGEHSRAVCSRCRGVRRARPSETTGGPAHVVEFSRDGIVWGDRFACVRESEKTAEARS